MKRSASARVSLARSSRHLPRDSSTSTSRRRQSRRRGKEPHLVQPEEGKVDEPVQAVVQAALGIGSLERLVVAQRVLDLAARLRDGKATSEEAASRGAGDQRDVDGRQRHATARDWSLLEVAASSVENRARSVAGSRPRARAELTQAARGGQATDGRIKAQRTEQYPRSELDVRTFLARFELGRPAVGSCVPARDDGWCEPSEGEAASRSSTSGRSVDGSSFMGG